MNEIESALKRKFERHRIVFWYDAKRELRSQFQGLELEGVVKVVVANNEFGLKHRMLREESDSRFLVYHEGPRPEDLENWLLDVVLAHDEFRTDKVALWLAELELGLEFAELAEVHEGFLKNARFRTALKKRLKPDDTEGRIRMHMLGVCCGVDSRLDSVLEALLHEMASGKDSSFKALQSAGLEPFLWEQVKRVYGYQASEPGLRDFVIELFKSCYAMSTEGEVKLAADALVFLKRWKDSRKLEGSFEHFSAECAEVLDLEQDLANWDVKDLVDLDLFRILDQKIIHDLVRAVSQKTMSVDDLRVMVRQRRQTHWYAEFADLYEAIDMAAQFLHQLEGVSLDFDSLEDGAKRYGTQWYKLDQLYRKFTLHSRRSKMTTLLGDLVEKVENGYDNQFLLKVNDRWQQLLDQEDKWKVPGLSSQRRFFRDRVRPFPGKDNKICVIISDAMRYEVGEELEKRIKQEDRYSASLMPGLSVMPSYTQLGMAALLPHEEISFAEQGKGMVLVDGQSSQGTANRAKILAKAGFKSVAIKSVDIMAMKREECRSLIREHEVFYVYHNRIDAVGHKLESEERAFEAVEETLEDLINLLKKLNNANLYNFLLTSDHGFLYQNRALDESDYSASGADGEEVWLRDRRFVVGKGLKPSKGLKSFSADQLGLAGDAEVQISKSINRMRLKGSGSRFVHGGASLQEVIVPVLQVNKKRQSDVEYVEVEVLGGGGSVITSGQLAVNFYQAQPVSEKVQPRELRVGIYTKDGDLISDRHDLRFDLDADNPRSRELHVRFLLTRDADKANHQEVILKLEEPVSGTTHFKQYKSARYTLRRSFTSDFDF